jgi:hypothetical protein
MVGVLSSDDETEKGVIVVGAVYSRSGTGQRQSLNHEARVWRSES